MNHKKGGSNMKYVYEYDAAGNIIKATASGIGIIGIAVICYAAYKITDRICKSVNKDKK
jgi:hypothetical protein